MTGSGAAMNLQIRDPRAHQLASQLAAQRRTSLTDAVITALEAELSRTGSQAPLAERLEAIADALRAKSRGTGREMTKDEVDAMWGHS
jgi:antitoxin VapB